MLQQQQMPHRLSSSSIYARLAHAAVIAIPDLCLKHAPADFIYSEYLTAQRKTEFKQLVWQIAQDYASATLLLRLPGYVPMPAFTAIEDVPLVVRHARKFPAQASLAALGSRHTKQHYWLAPRSGALQ